MFFFIIFRIYGNVDFVINYFNFIGIKILLKKFMNNFYLVSLRDCFIRSFVFFYRI